MIAAAPAAPGVPVIRPRSESSASCPRSVAASYGVRDGGGAGTAGSGEAPEQARTRRIGRPQMAGAAPRGGAQRCEPMPYNIGGGAAPETLGSAAPAPRLRQGG